MKRSLHLIAALFSLTSFAQETGCPPIERPFITLDFDHRAELIYTLEKEGRTCLVYLSSGDSVEFLFDGNAPDHPLNIESAHKNSTPDTLWAPGQILMTRGGDNGSWTAPVAEGIYLIRYRDTNNILKKVLIAPEVNDYGSLILKYKREGGDSYYHAVPYSANSAPDLKEDWADRTTSRTSSSYNRAPETGPLTEEQERFYIGTAAGVVNDTIRPAIDLGLTYEWSFLEGSDRAWRFLLGAEFIHQNDPQLRPYTGFEFNWRALYLSTKMSFLSNQRIDHSLKGIFEIGLEFSDFQMGFSAGGNYFDEDKVQIMPRQMLHFRYRF